MIFQILSVLALAATTAEGKSLFSSALAPRLLKALADPFSPPSEANVSASCIAQSQYFLQELKHLSPWALNMYDASTKIPSALITGNIWQLGGYDQCININHETPSSIGVIHGKYCAASITLSEPNKENNSENGDFTKLIGAAFKASGLDGRRRYATASWSLCVPSGCSASDVLNVVYRRLATAVAPELPPPVILGDEACHVSAELPAEQPLRSSEVAFLSAVLLLLLTSVLATTYDVYSQKSVHCHEGEEPAWEKYLLAFSVRRSGKQLLAGSPGDTLGCLHGLRVLSTGWVILLHSAYTAAMSPNMNSALIPKLGDSWVNMIVMNATLSTDTFFLLSGLLLARGFLRKRDKFNLITFYWHRFMRLTPVNMMLVWFYATLFYRLGSGPLWSTLVGTERDNCVANWWTNLLFVNNYVDIIHPCMQHTWYLAVDMQLIIASPFILIPLKRTPRIGACLLSFLILAAIAAPFVVTFVDKLSPAMLYTLDLTMLGEVYLKIYKNMYTRAGPYLIGMALAFYMHHNRTGQLRLPKAFNVLAWLTAAVCCLAALFGVFSFYQVDHAYNALEAASYAALHRSAWACGVAWLVFACIHGYGGILNRFLSWGAFVPLSRLSFSVYLCHFIFVLLHFGRIRSPGYFDRYEVVSVMISTLMISLVLSAFLYMLIEYPFQCIDRLLFTHPPEKMITGTVSAKSRSPSGGADTLSVHANIAQDLESGCAGGYDNAAYEKTAEDDATLSVTVRDDRSTK